MKKKILLPGGIVLLVVAVMVGFFVYLSTRTPNEKHGITMSVSNVSSTGLKLHMKRETGTTRPYVWNEYKVQKWYPFGWEPVELNLFYSFEKSEMINIGENFSHTWNLDWEEGCGRLSSGIYRVQKEVGSGTRTESYYAPFFVIDWWEATFVAVIIILAIFLFRERHPKRCLVIVFLISVIGMAGTIIYLNLPAKEQKWGISLEIIEHSSKELTYKLTRKSDETESDLKTAGYSAIKRWTLWGWKKAELYPTVTNQGFSMYQVEPGFSQSWNMEWEHFGRRAPTGVYRLEQVVVNQHNYEEQQEYYDTFVIINWWKIALFASVALYFLLRIRIKKWMLLDFVLVMICVGWMVSISCAGTQCNFKVQQTTGAYIEGVVAYNDASPDEIVHFMTTTKVYRLETRTLFGWKKMKDIYAGDDITVTEGKDKEHTFSWSDYEVLPKGTYRIRQPYEIWSKKDGTVKRGEMRIRFKNH